MRGDAGFSLAETLIMVVLFLMLAGALFVSFLTGQTAYLSGDAAIQVQEEARKAFDNMVRELRESATMTCAGSCAATKRINFQIAMGYAGGAVMLGNGTPPPGGTKFVHYELPNAGSNGQLRRCIDDGALTTPLQVGCQVLANNVDGTNSSFAWDATTNTVECRLQVSYSNVRLPGGKMLTPVLTSRVKLRN